MSCFLEHLMVMWSCWLLETLLGEQWCFLWLVFFCFVLFLFNSWSSVCDISGPFLLEGRNAPFWWANGILLPRSVLSSTSVSNRTSVEHLHIMLAIESDCTHVITRHLLLSYSYAVTSFVHRFGLISKELCLKVDCSLYCPVNCVIFLLCGSSSATTHTDLVLRARQAGIEVGVVHNASIMNAIGCCGLQVGYLCLNSTCCFLFWWKNEWLWAQCWAFTLFPSYSTLIYYFLSDWIQILQCIHFCGTVPVSIEPYMFIQEKPRFLNQLSCKEDAYKVVSLVWTPIHSQCCFLWISLLVPCPAFSLSLCHLQLYNYGETVSLVFWTDTWRPESFYDKICANYQRGMHTLCLLGKRVTAPRLSNVWTMDSSA